jgi:hypothetical protein
VPYLSGITCYPIKSLDPVSMLQTRIVEGGGLEHDREFGIFDSEGRYVNGKRNPRVHLLRAAVNWKDGTICLEPHGEDGAPLTPVILHLQRERERLDAWLSGFFDAPVTLRQNARGGFPDDTKAPGPTVIGEATLQAVASWFPGLELAETRRRFRANLEIADAPAFWEDRLFGPVPEEPVRFRIGEVTMEGTNPCQRCVVPTRDTRTGEQVPEFSVTFRARREAALPEWAAANRFNHYYRLAVNTCVPESEVGKTLRVGDPIVLL